MVKKEPCRVQGFFTFWGFCPGFVFWRYQRACVAACSLISSSWSFIESQCMVTGVSTAFNATGGRLFSLKKARNSSSCWLEKPFRTIISSWKFCPRLNTEFCANPGISNKNPRLYRYSDGCTIRREIFCLFKYLRIWRRRFSSLKLYSKICASDMAKSPLACKI